MYNLRFGGKTGLGNHWQKVIAEFDPEIIFAQESFDPNQYLGAFSPLTRELTSASNFSLFTETNRDNKVVSGIKGVGFKVSGNEMNSV